MGRPKKEVGEVKVKIASVRLLDSDVDLLNEACVVTGKSASDILREALVIYFNQLGLEKED